jgi:hypothetical protein
VAEANTTANDQTSTLPPVVCRPVALAAVVPARR